MIRDQNPEGNDNQIIEYYTMDDIDKETLRKYRQIYEIRNDGHVWNALDDKSFLEKLGGYRKDRRTGVEGLTLAGLLMFGTGQAVREGFVNMIIHADYLMDAGVLKVIKKSDAFEFTNPGILKLPLEDIYRGGNSKSRNPHMQTMLRLVGFGDNAGSGFPTILDVWKSEGWIKPELIEYTNLD